MPRNTAAEDDGRAWQNVMPADLALLIRTVELGSFSAVARERNLPTSNVSRAVSRLEAAWGVRLLRRSTHAMSLTPEGELAVDLGRQCLAKLAEIGERVAAPHRRIGGVVRLAISAAVARHVVVPALPLLSARHPELVVELLVDDKANDFTLEGVDLAVRTGVILDESLVARRIGSFRRGLFASSAYLRQRGIPRAPADLDAHVFVTHQNTSRLNRLRFSPSSGSGERMLAGSYRASSTATMADMVWHGLGIGYMSELVMRSGVASGEIVEVLPGICDPERYPIYLVYQADRLRPLRVTALIAFLGELFGPELAVPDPVAA